MKKITLSRGLLALSFLFVVGCGTTETDSSANATSEAVPAATEEVAEVAEVAAVEDDESVDGGSVEEACDPEIDGEDFCRAIPPKVSVIYFDFDDSSINADFKSVTQAWAMFLKKNADAGTPIAIKIAGHTDERGTREYNLALGERRAKSVAKLLSAAGVSSSLYEVVSYGEEKPANYFQSDVAYTQNRRVELKIAD